MSEPIRVLLVDDDEGVAEVTATYLERASDDIATLVETSAADGLDRLTASADAVDCVVSDYDMPRTNGLEFLEAVREVDEEIPFVLFTGKGSEEIASEAISAGVTDYLQKETGAEQYEVLANRVENAVAQHRAQQEAEAANRRIRRLFRRITDAFFALDDDWRFTYINQQAAEPTGYGPEELVGMRLGEVLDEERGEEFHRAYRRAYEDQEVVTLETESAIRPGRWVEERVYPSEDGVSVYYRDVTERKRVERELQETKRKIEELHSVATRAVACETPGEVHDLAVEAAEEILDFDLCAIDVRRGDDLVLVATSSSLPPGGSYERTPLDATDSLAARTYRTGESFVVDDLSETDVEPATDEYRSVLSVPIGDLGVFQAAAEQRAAFDEDDQELAELLVAHVAESLSRVRTGRQLRSERDRFLALFENVPSPVVNAEFRDGRPVVQDVNAAFESEFGWTAERLAGEPLDEFIVPEGAGAEAAELNRRTRDEERIRGAEVRRRTADGVRDFLLYTVPVDGGGEWFSVYTDITDQKQRERRLQRQNERLDEFASVISHDLCSPLNVAKGRLELLEGDCDSRHVPAVREAVDRMDDLVDDVLSLARQGQVVSEAEPVPLASVAEDAWATVAAGDAELRVVDDLGSVSADEGRLRELLENLFRNSVEHGAPAEAADGRSDVDPGGESDEPTVVVRVGALPDEEGFYVADDGPGIPERDREAVFEHGYSTSPDGTGLGLAIVSRIAEAHGWTATATESRAGGARIELRT